MVTDGRAEDAALAMERALADDRIDGPGGDLSIPPMTDEQIEAIVDEALAEETADQARDHDDV